MATRKAIAKPETKKAVSNTFPQLTAKAFLLRYSIEKLTKKQKVHYMSTKNK
jgi:hypothetical protein